MTFKVGDKVRCVDANRMHSELTNGREYLVESVDGNQIGITSDLGGVNSMFFSNRFILVQEDKLPHELLGLPRFFCVEKDESDPLWGLFLVWFNNFYQCSWGGELKFYGYDGDIYSNGTDGKFNLHEFSDNATLITLAERDRCVNKKQSQTMTESQKAKAYDDIMGWIDVSVGWDDKESATEALDSILKYTLGIYGAKQMKPEDVIEDRATKTPDGEYENIVRGLFCPIQDDAWYYGYKAGKDILQPKTE